MKHTFEIHAIGTVQKTGEKYAIQLEKPFLEGLTYAILSYRLTLQHKRKINAHFSYREGINLNWLRHCILGIAIFFLTAAVVVTLREGLGITFPFNADYLIYTIIILFIFYLGYFGIRHQDMFTHNPESEKTHPRTAGSQEKYKRSGVKQDRLQEMHATLRRYMEEEQINFHDFVNRYRIQEFLHLATQNKSFSMGVT